MDEMTRRRMAEALMANDPRNQVPGMGSMANAVPLPNQLVDERRYYDEMGEDGAIQAGIGFGGAIGSLASAPLPLKLPAAAALGTYGVMNQLRQVLGDHRSRKLGYQGN